MKNEQLVMHSLSTGQRTLEEALEAYAAAGFRHVEPYLGLVKESVKVSGAGHRCEDAIRLAAEAIAGRHASDVGVRIYG